MAHSRLLVVTFDAAARTFSITPDPISIPPGETILYFGLQTANRGEAPEAEFSAIVENDLIAEASPVDGSGQLWRVRIVNEPAPKEAEVHEYSLSVTYNSKDWIHDPTVILQPPPIGP